ncbi:aerolysin-like protein [Patiria miniata]|uniref:Jacalin-type lectin domain-containing protein n=1 Tax=Patiria miniata TaxID=46514 RepID=A0A913ZNI4_PATMI|nr:aerolysin-like protein [Patiria miniata]
MPSLVPFSDINTKIFCTNQASGGSGGKAKTFIKMDTGAVMTKIQAWKEDWRIRGVEMTMSDGTQQLFGSRTGSGSLFTLNSGETLRRLNIQASGQKSSGGYVRLGAIWMETSQGRSWGIFSRYLTEDGRYWYDMPNSGIVCGMFGKYGDDVDCLGFAVMNPIERARLVNVTYPNLDLKVVADTPTIVASNEYSNGTSVNQSYTLTGEKTVTTERSWSVTTGFEMSYSVSVSASIPQVADIEASTSWTLSSETTHSRSETISEEQGWEWPIVCPPYMRIRASGTMYQDSIDNAYEAKVHIDLKNGQDYEYAVKGIYEGMNVRHGLLKVEELGPP